jgi:hypothetical protein
LSLLIRGILLDPGEASPRLGGFRPRRGTGERQKALQAQLMSKCRGLMVAIAELPKPLCDVLRCTRMARTLPEDQKAIGARSRVVSVFP